ncbi:MAG TPA: DUF433 domain-containing protein [Leptolyngbyaceae cyanobacterium M65_K2018_010]|nr:DUF433 domain-containing protein [Leptolyngbyaceae cyanobacterium M65_K2018_010]
MTARITVDPQIHFGKPCVAGTRITVQNVLELLTEGLSFQEIIEDYYPDQPVKLGYPLKPRNSAWLRSQNPGARIQYPPDSWLLNSECLL